VNKNVKIMSTLREGEGTNTKKINERYLTWWEMRWRKIKMEKGVRSAGLRAMGLDRNSK
jgi:hypothetical protein